MPQSKKADGETSEDLESKGAEFDVETADGTIKIVLPPLKPRDSEPER
jgi:hypothetical protein